MAEGMIFDIQRGSTVDGPGVRTTVFFKGCNLRCAWCHNPESQQMQRQKMFFEEKCIHCGRCKQVCPSPESCILCGGCAQVCPREAISLCGRMATATEIFAEIRRDAPFYELSGGGVTCSGGECMLQMELMCALLQMCKVEGIHTAVDTAGLVPWAAFEQVMPHTDLFLYDVKCATDGLHQQWTGVSNRLILENLTRLSETFAGEIIVRIPVIGGVNDTDEEMARMADILRPLRVKAVELLPYHRMGEYKYAALGKEAIIFSVPEEGRMARLRAIFEEAP